MAEIKKLEAAYQQLATAYGYKNVAAFESEMKTYVERFEREAEVIAKDILNQGQHLLLEQEEALTDANLNKLFKDLGWARAALAKVPDQSVNDKIAEGIVGWEASPSLDDYNNVISEVVAISKTDPLLMAHLARDGVTLPVSVKLASLKNVGDLRDLLLKSIKSKREDVHKARYFLEKDPKLVWRFDVVQEQTKARSDVEPGSLYDSILKDKREADAKSSASKKVKEAILAIVLGALTFGTGTIAVLASMTAIVVGVDGAMDAVRQYQIESSAHGAGLLSSDPSFAWVVLAFAGVGLDGLGVGGLVKGVTKTARAAELLQDGSPIGNAVRAFNKADDQMAALTKLDDELKAAEKELKLANSDLRMAIMREARAEAKANAVAPGPVLMIVNPKVTSDTIAKSFAFPAFQLLRQGRLGLSRFLKMRRVRAMTGEINGPEALKKVTEAYEKSVREAKAIAERIQQLKLPDDVVEQASKIWARSPDMTASEFVETAQRIKRLKLNDESFERALVSWELNPKMPVGEFMENLKTMSRIVFKEGQGAKNISPQALAAHFGYPAFRSVQKGEKFTTMPEVVALVGKVDELGPNGKKIVEEAYRLAKGEAEKVVKRAKELKVSDDALDEALTMWRLNHSMTVDEFMRKLPGYTPRGTKIAPVRAAKEFNDGKTMAINAPDEVMDATTRDVLRRRGGPPTAEKIAGTGGVQKIEAREINGEVHVSIEGEILPHRLKREGNPEAGQSPAPNFNKANYEKPRPKE
jgi:hypothetical protein